MLYNILFILLEPWDGPVITRQESIKINCVVIEWTPPSQPNGVIIRYEVCLQKVCLLSAANLSAFIECKAKCIDHLNMDFEGITLFALTT